LDDIERQSRYTRVKRSKHLPGDFVALGTARLYERLEIDCATPFNGGGAFLERDSRNRQRAEVALVVSTWPATLVMTLVDFRFRWVWPADEYFMEKL